jgi:hypothetical protein
MEIVAIEPQQTPDTMVWQRPSGHQSPHGAGTESKPVGDVIDIQDG